MTVSRYVGAVGIATVAVIAVLWLMPPVGFVAALVLLVLLPPWGRSLSERAVISGVVLVGLIALAFPRAGSTPLTHESTRLFLSIVLLGVLALRAVPTLRNAPIPRPQLTDVIVGGLALASSFWLVSAYLGRTATQIVGGLFFSGWDNHAHYTTFANTYVSQSTTWPTLDGSTAWNQWYPTLHSTVMAVAEMAFRTPSVPYSRPDLLWPYVLWNAITFSVALAALAWVAGDLAARLGGRDRARWTRPIAAAAFAAFGLLGSPGLLYNHGFTNFVVGIAIAVVGAYLGARSWKSARVLGWFVIPLAVLAAVGLWTPLAVCLVPSAVVVAVALFRHRRWMGAVWLVAGVLGGAVVGLAQASAILSADKEVGASDVTQTLGSIAVGMSPFNVGMALAAPVVVILLAVLLVQRRQWTLAVAVLGPVLGAFVVAVAFMQGADATGTSRLQSYYVLKPLNAVLIAVAPIIAALLAVAIGRAVQGMRTSSALVGVGIAGVIVVAAFGYVGSTPAEGRGGIGVADGVQAGIDRLYGFDENPVMGEVIMRSRDAAEPLPAATTLLWDNDAGNLANLWIASLHGTLSTEQQQFYGSLPPPPSNAKTQAYGDLWLSQRPDARLAVLWFRPGSEMDVSRWSADNGQVDAVRVPMPSNAACPDCTS